MLRHWIDAAETTLSLSRRARIVLLSGEGWGPSPMARELSCSRQTPITWRERYRTSGVAGLTGGVRSGRPPTTDETAVISRAPGSGARWSTRSLGADLGLSNVAVANIWRRWGIKPMAGRHVLLMTQPVLDVPVTTVVGLHVSPAAHVLAVLTGRAAPADRSTATTPTGPCWPPCPSAAGTAPSAGQRPSPATGPGPAPAR